MINGLHHSAISTPDLDRALAFYEFLGFKIVARSGWDKGEENLDRIVGMKDSVTKFAMMWTGNGYLEFFQYAHPVGRPRDPAFRPADHGITHICVDVTDVDKEYERMKQAGMRFNTEPRDVFGVRTTYGQDPDGNIVELQEVLGWDDIKLPTAST